MALLHVVLGLLAAERGFELLLSRRNQSRLMARGGRVVAGDGFGPILAAHVLLFPAMLVESASAPWAGAWSLTWPLIGFAFAAQGLRYWAVWALGERWCTRVIVVPGAPLVTRGPYRWLRHPNYVAIGLELLALPLAFQLPVTAIGISIGNALALRRRISREEAALNAAVEGAA